MIFRILAHIGLYVLGGVSGDKARRRSQARAAVNPLRERTWTLVKVMLILGVLAWLFGFGGMHALSGRS